MEKFMKTTLRAFSSVAICAAAAMLASCSNDADGSYAEEVTPGRVVTMHLNGDRPSYSDTRAVTSDWNAGDVIYLRFHLADGATVVCGKAAFDDTDSTWNVSYYGNLSSGNSYRCEAYFFTGATAVDNFNIEMSPTSCAYVDTNATYMIDGDELFVTASLSPKTARMRVSGTANQKITVAQMQYCTSFNLTDNSFTTSDADIDTQIGADGYTPYFYCSLPETNEMALYDTYYRYTKAFDPEKFAPGMSGYVVMPSQVENKGWAQAYYYPDEAVDLGLSVRWATHNVGAANQHEAGILCSWGDKDGTNTLTSSGYNQNVNEIAGNPAYDIATNLWNERWQIPTQEQWQELIDSCTWVYNKASDSEHGVYGYTVTGPNGNSIYLPMYDYVIAGGTVETSNSSGYYWTATEYQYGGGSEAQYIYVYSGGKRFDEEYKYYQMTVRPVLAR